jgi:hypothetical protein
VQILRLAERPMFDNNITVKLLLAFGAAAFWALLMFGVRLRLDLGADKWSIEKFGVWWAGRALIVLVIFVAGIGFVFAGKGSSAGVQVLFLFSGGTALGEFIRRKM